MNPYPLELRQRIVEAVDQGGSALEVARRFRVATNSVYNLLELRQQTGSLLPRPNPGGRRPAVDPDRHDELRALVAEQPDISLEGIRERLGLSCSLAAISRALTKLKLTRKKKRSTRPSSGGPTSRPSARRGPSGRRA
jgi:transposase